MSRVLDPKNEVILAHSANGKPLPEDHGYPVRLLCPGFIGLRSVKWLHKLWVSDQESQCRFQQRAYKTYKEKDWWHADPSKYEPPMGHVHNSVISFPTQGSHVNVDPKKSILTLRGVAVGEGGAGARVEKVEISTDEGKTWTNATIT